VIWVRLILLRQKMWSQQIRDWTPSTARAGALSGAVPRSSRGTRCARISRRAYADYEIDKIDHDAGKKITIRCACGRAGNRERRSDAARHLEKGATVRRAGRFGIF